MSTDLLETCPKCGREPRYIYARPPSAGEGDRAVVVHADCGGVLGRVPPDQCPHCGGPALTLQPGRRPFLTYAEMAALMRESGGELPAPEPELRPCYCEGARDAARAKMPTLKDLIAALPAEERAELVSRIAVDHGRPGGDCTAHAQVRGRAIERVLYTEPAQPPQVVKLSPGALKAMEEELLAPAAERSISLVRLVGVRAALDRMLQRYSQEGLRDGELSWERVAAEVQRIIEIAEGREPH